LTTYERRIAETFSPLSLVGQICGREVRGL